MALVTVWTFDSPHLPRDYPGFRRAATQAAINNYRYTRRPDSLEVDELLLGSQGFTRDEYLTFTVEVIHSKIFEGYDGEGRKCPVRARRYEARLTLREFNMLEGAEQCVRLIEVDSPGGDIWIKINDYPELAQFPYVENRERIVVDPNARVTDPKELDL